jgi:hypothetical protein
MLSVSAELKIMITAACSAAYIAAAATPTESYRSVFDQSNMAISALGLGQSKEALASRCLSELTSSNRFDSELLKKAEPRLRAAFENVCAIAYSGKKGHETALFLMYPLSDAAKGAGNEVLARAAEHIIELRHGPVYSAAR